MRLAVLALLVAACDDDSCGVFTSVGETVSLASLTADHADGFLATWEQRVDDEWDDERGAVLVRGGAEPTPVTGIPGRTYGVAIGGPAGHLFSADDSFTIVSPSGDRVVTTARQGFPVVDAIATETGFVLLERGRDGYLTETVDGDGVPVGTGQDAVTTDGDVMLVRTTASTWVVFESEQLVYVHRVGEPASERTAIQGGHLVSADSADETLVIVVDHVDSVQLVHVRDDKSSVIMNRPELNVFDHVSGEIGIPITAYPGQGYLVSETWLDLDLMPVGTRVRPSPHAIVTAEHGAELTMDIITQDRVVTAKIALARWDFGAMTPQVRDLVETRVTYVESRGPCTEPL